MCRSGTTHSRLIVHSQECEKAQQAVSKTTQHQTKTAKSLNAAEHKHKDAVIHRENTEKAVEVRTRSLVNQPLRDLTSCRKNTSVRTWSARMSSSGRISCLKCIILLIATRFVTSHYCSMLSVLTDSISGTAFAVCLSSAWSMGMTATSMACQFPRLHRVSHICHSTRMRPYIRVSFVAYRR